MWLYSPYALTLNRCAGYARGLLAPWLGVQNGSSYIAINAVEHQEDSPADGDQLGITDPECFLPL